MRLLRRLAFYHSDTLQGKLPEVCLCLIQEVLKPPPLYSDLY